MEAVAFYNSINQHNNYYQFCSLHYNYNPTYRNIFQMYLGLSYLILYSLVFVSDCAIASKDRTMRAILLLVNILFLISRS